MEIFAMDILNPHDYISERIHGDGIHGKNYGDGIMML